MNVAVTKPILKKRLGHPFKFYKLFIFIFFAQIHFPLSPSSASESCQPHNSNPQRQGLDLRKISQECEKASTGSKSFCNGPNNRPRGECSKVCYSPNPAEARACLKEWPQLSTEERGNRIRDAYVLLLDAHGLNLRAELLTCKTFRESYGDYSFDYNARPYSKSSPQPLTSAFGLTQVLSPTARDLFNRGFSAKSPEKKKNSPGAGRWFTPKVPNFTEIKDGLTYYRKIQEMPISLLAQMELGMAVLQQKALDASSTKESTLLQRYYGNCAPKNSAYANDIIRCANCITRSRPSLVTDRCLQLAKAPEPSCTGQSAGKKGRGKK